MLNLSSLFLMLSFLLLPSAYAEESDNKKILVEQAWTDVANKKFYSDQINKIVIQTIAKYRGYEFFMSNANLGKDTILNRLKIVVKKRQKNLHFVEVLQMSGRNNQPLKGSWADNVPERFILLQIRVSVAEALYGRKIAMEVMQTLKDQDNAFKEFMEKRSPQDNSIDREEKDLPEKAPPPAESKKKVTSNQSEEDDEDEDPATEYNSSLTTNQTLPQYLEMKENRMMARAVKAQSKAVTDQSEEIEDVQAAVRKGMKERKSSKGKDEEKAADQKSFLDLSSPDQQKAPRPPFEKSTRPRVTRTILDTVYLNRFVYTKYIVESNNNFNFMGGALYLPKQPL